MNADGKAGLDRRLEDRPVAALAEKLAGAAQEQDVGETAIAGAFANLDAGQFAVLIGNDDGGLEPRIAPVPAFELILVGGKRHGGAELVVLLALPGRRKRIHHAPFDPVEIEMLLAHEVEIARRQSAAGRPGVAPRRKRMALGIGKAFDVAVALTLPVGLQIIPPAIAEIGTQILERALGMDIAVEDADPRLGPDLWLPHLDVHGGCSFKGSAATA